MRIRNYATTDHATLQRWLKRWGHMSVPPSELPPTGFIVPGVAIAFIRRCEGNVVIFDSLCSNSRVSPATRHKAMDALFVHVKAIAELEGFTRILGFSSDAGVVERATRHGFKQLQHSTLAYSKE